MGAVLAVEEAKRLVKLCEAGRLYEVEAWIGAGRSLTVPNEVRKTPLTVAMSTGFHSLVELLLRHEHSQEVKNDALRQALFLNRPAFIELALAHEADIASIPFLDVLMTGDRAIVTAFLERGADPIAGYPFAHAFHQLRAKTTLGSYLDCRRNRPHLAEDLQCQADMALRQFCQEDNLKWVSLLMWAGANPRSRGPALDDVEHIEDPEWHTTALHEACASGNVEILKRLKPNRTDDLAGMLERAAFSAHRDILAYVFDLGANPNDRPDGGSSALEACIRHLGWEDFDRIRYSYGANYKTPGYKVSKGREAIKLLLKHGAMWKPEPSTLNDTRRILYRIEPEVTVELIGLLLNHENGEDAIRELLRVPRMRQHVASCEGQLSRLGILLDGRRRSDVRATPAPSPYVLAQYESRTTLRRGLVRADAEGGAQVRNLRRDAFKDLQAARSSKTATRVLGEEETGPIATTPAKAGVSGRAEASNLESRIPCLLAEAVIGWLDLPLMSVTREKLYEEVWSKPMTVVAAGYDVSANYLARVCEHLNVPRPPRGYWAKLQFGKRPKRPPLPAARPGEVLDWTKGASVPRPVRVRDDHGGNEQADRGNTEERPSRHPLVLGVREFFEAGRFSEVGYLRPRKRNLVDVFVSKEALTE